VAGGVQLCLRSDPDRSDGVKIEFRHDVESVLKEAKKQKKPVLLDFSAAPM
jgi:hypothetical protein